MYLEHSLVLESFKRLRTNAVNGKRSKTPMERTSSLMIMLAVDATSKKYGVQTLDIDFERPKGKQMRQELALQYSRLVTVNKSDDNRMQSVYELGFVAIGGKDPHVVAATKSENPFEYPHRPAPLLHLGKVATGMRYGIQLHPNWEEGISQHLSDVSSNTPFTDLAMFCMRFNDYSQQTTLTETLCGMLRDYFSKDVADFWVGRIKAERMFAKHLRADNFMETNLVDSLSTINNTQTRRSELMKLDKEQLIDLIIKLETSN